MGIKETGNRVHMRRRALGLTQQQLADLCGFPYQIISRVEKGHQDLYAQRLALIATHLQVSADYLLGLTDTAAPVAPVGSEKTPIQASPAGRTKRPPATVSVPAFDETRYMLGPLCPNGHDFDGAGHSLKLRGQTGIPGACVTCTEARRQAARQRRRRET